MALAMFLVSAVFAQEEESPRMWAGGELTFGSLSARQVTIGPSWGMMLTDELGVGASIYFSAGDDSFAWGFDPYARYYIPVVDKFSFYGDAYVGLGGGNNNTAIEGHEGYFSFSVGARVGLQYWFTSSWSIAASTRVLDFTLLDGDASFGGGLNANSVNFSLFWHFFRQ